MIRERRKEMDPGELGGMIVFFATAFMIVRTIVNSPKNKAKAEIMKQQQLAGVQDQKNLLSAVRAEELDMTMQAQEKRIALLEEELAFLRKLAEEKSKTARGQ
jgi:hypothetical protein